MKEEYLQILEAIKDIPNEEFLKLWNEELKEFDDVGPSVGEFLLNCKRFYFQNKPQETEIINTFNQKFTSGFFFIL